MSTTHEMFTAEELEDFVHLLKDWPNCEYGNDEAMHSVTPFLTFYFTFDPEHYLETSLAMIDIHEAFEKLAGKPYTIATHPHSERPHPYGSKRLGNLREWARKTRLDEHFVYKFTDEKNHASSPATAGYFWRTVQRNDGKIRYSYIQFYYRWQWWLDHRDAWRRFVLDTIERLRPAQVYSGFAMANPLEFGTRSAVTVWDRALAPHFHGLDTDYPFSMTNPWNLPSGIRPPTWGFFLADDWRERLGLSRGQLRDAIQHPEIAITECGNGQWIELGKQPELYPVENGVPELPAMLNRLLKPIRPPNLDLTGFGQWDGDPNVRFDRADTQRWLARFDDDGDWPDPATRTPGQAPSPAAEESADRP